MAASRAPLMGSPSLSPSVYYPNKNKVKLKMFKSE